MDYNSIMRFKDLTEQERKILIDAVWMRQKCFIAGDKMFKEYGYILDELRDNFDYVPERYR